MSETFIVIFAFFGAILLGVWLYRAFSTAGDTAIATFGLIRNGSTLLIGIFLLMTGSWPFVIAGGLLIMLAVFLGSAHASNLDNSTSLRKRLSG
ncbi:hypothetical protein [Haloarcula sediminis]|uniref:hypothetical protein n=1 Tax=Haloarcula sediminis TaxID=3111777 RepID=UPI002D785E77|nr:hypothetical protein [Haloarcula sp. CK38]